MSILKYIEKYKNYSFEEKELNEVDIAIFSVLAYLSFDEIFTSKRMLIPALKSLLKKDKTYYKDMYRGPSFRKYIEAVSKAKRYRAVSISNYIDEIDYKAEKQFSAITYHIPRHGHIVLFRGTDRKLISWKEDFNLSFSKTIPAQKAALSYLNKMLLKYRGPFIVAGHSKGGNLSVYASSNAIKIFQHKIKEVYSFDAPGFDKTLIETIEKYKDRIKNYYPKDSVVGMILYNSGISYFVDSYKARLQQHDVLNWKTSEDMFLPAEQSKFSKFINEVLNEWVNAYDVKQKEKFFAELFDLLEAKEGTKVSDMSKLKSIVNYIGKIGTQYSKLSKAKKSELRTQISQFLAIGKKAYDKNK